VQTPDPILGLMDRFTAAINAHDPNAAQNGDTAADNKNTLADRIRALQSSASRVATSTSTN